MGHDDSISNQLTTDLKVAMRSGDTSTRDTIRFILAAMKNAAIEKRAPLNRQEEVAVLRRMHKQLDDATEQYRAAGRTELADKELTQVDVLKKYLPSELTDDELSSAVAEIIRETGASSVRDMGKVIPAAIAKLGDRVDGRRISQAVRQQLGTLES